MTLGTGDGTCSLSRVDGSAAEETTLGWFAFGGGWCELSDLLEAVEWLGCRFGCGLVCWLVCWLFSRLVCGFLGRFFGWFL